MDTRAIRTWREKLCFLADQPESPDVRVNFTRNSGIEECKAKIHELRKDLLTQLQREEAITADPMTKFELKERIRECKQSLMDNLK